VLIQIINSARDTNRVQLFPELYPHFLVALPVDAQKWFLLDSYDGRRSEEFRHPTSATLLPAGRMRRIRRGSDYYQLQPLQRTITSWEIGTGFRWDGVRWVRIDVTSDSQNPRFVSVDITPIYDCDRVSKICFEINDFDFRTRISTEENLHPAPGRSLRYSADTSKAQEVVRLSRYHRPPVI